MFFQQFPLKTKKYKSSRKSRFRLNKTANFNQNYFDKKHLTFVAGTVYSTFFNA